MLIHEAVVFIDLPCNPLSVNVVIDGSENRNGVLGGVHFFDSQTRQQISLNRIDVINALPCDT